MFLYHFLIFTLIVILSVWFFFFSRKAAKKFLLKKLDTKLFLIKIKQSSKEGKDLKQEISYSERLFETVSSFKEPLVFEVAVPHIGQDICFYAAIKSKYAAAFVRQIQSFWSDAFVEEVEDYNIFNYNGFSFGAYLKLKERFVLPLKTYDELNVDTFLPILGTLSKIEEIGEGAALQVLILPAEKRQKKEMKSALKVLKEGWSMKDVLQNKFSISFSDILSALSGKSEESKEKKTDDEAIKLVSEKASKALFKVNVRIVASAEKEEEARNLLDSLGAAFEQFGAPNRNEFVLVKPANIKKFFYNFSFREFNEAESMVLSSNELASIFHLPTPFTDIPRILYLKYKELAPPSNLPSQGILIGYSSFRGEKKEVRITEEDRRRHLYVIGQTGTGKSNFLANMIISDIRDGKGVAVIDPHGDLVEDVLSTVPQKRIDDVIFFNPGNLERPIGLNMLEYDFNRPEQKTTIVNEMLQIFDKLYDLKTTGGPMFEQYMRNALLLLMEDAPNEPATLMEVPRVFSDTEFRLKKLARIKNPVVQDFWEKEAMKAGGEAALENITPYITSKFNNFTANDYMRPIVGQVKSAFNFREIMDEGKILLVNLSKGRIGDLNAALLGMIFVGKILMSALGRVDIPQEQRRDFYLYIDEFQNFTTDSIAIILSEARKYRLNLIIAHQFIAQLTEKIRDAVFGNVGSMVAFRVGPQDAEFLEKVFAPSLNVQDLSNIDNFNAYVRLLINGQTSKPFNIKAPKAPKGDYEKIKTLEKVLYLKYGVPREVVELEIHRRLRE
jgi:hypothetical protein